MFDSSYLKTERAKKHIGELDEFLKYFLDKNSDRIIRNLQPGAAVQYVAFEALQAPPMIPFIIGDVCHNLRSALDHVAAAICPAAEQSASKFPMSKTVDGFKQAVATHIKPYSDSMAKALLRKIDADSAWHKAIYGINAMNNSDKHRRVLLAVTTTSVVAKDIQIGGVAIGSLEATNTALPIVIYGGTPVKFGQDFEPSVSIVFGRGEAFDGQSVIPTLREAVEFFVETINICRNAYV